MPAVEIFNLLDHYVSDYVQLILSANRGVQQIPPGDLLSCGSIIV